MSRALLALGHDVVFACYHQGDGPLPRELDVMRAQRIPGVRIEKSGPHWSRPLQDLALARVVARALRRRPIDLIAAHNVEGPAAAWLGRRLAGVSVPIAYHQHTLMAEELPTYFADGRWAHWLGRGLDRAIPAISDGGVAISERGRDGLIRQGLQSFWCPPGVDLAEVSGGDREAARTRWGLRGPVVLYAGNTDPYQDLPLLYEAMREVPATLLIATATRAVAAPSDAVVVATPDLSSLADALAAADVAVLPRRVCAGFPMKLLNHVAAGVPTVAVGESARAVPGVVATRPHDLGATLRRLLNAPARLDSLRDDITARRADWSWEARAQDLVHAYTKIISINKS